MDSKGTGIQWTSGRSMEYIQIIWHCSLTLSTHTASVGMRINKNKTTIMKVKTVSPQTVMLTYDHIGEV